MHIEPQLDLTNTTSFIIIREIPLVSLHLYTASYKVIYYFRLTEPLYQGIGASGQGHQEKHICTIYYKFSKHLHVKEYTHLLYVYV